MRKLFIASLVLPAGLSLALRPTDLFTTLGVVAAWKTSQGAGTVVGIVDLGFDFHHPALKGRLEPGYFSPGVYHTPAPAVTGHGTAVASVIGGRSVTHDPLIGLAPEARMVAASQGMPEHTLMRIAAELRRDGAAQPAALQAKLAERGDEIRNFSTRWLQHMAASTSEGIRYLVDRGARVIAIAEYLPMQLLAQSATSTAQVQDAFRYAAEHDVLIVLGAGNNDMRVDEYPGTRTTVLVVGAATRAGERWSREVRVGGRGARQGSNYGARLDVLAPAFNVRVAIPHEPGFYRLSDSPVGPVEESFTGAYRNELEGATSLATAVAAGLATLVRAAAPELTASQVIDVIHRGAIDSGEPGRDDLTGHGVIHFARTMALRSGGPSLPNARRQRRP